MNHENCPICDSSQTREIVRASTIERSGKTLDYQRTSFVCASCATDFMSADQVMRNRRAVVAAEARALDCPRPEEILRWRKTWGLSQQQAGAMLKVGPTAFSKYENSALTPSGPTSQLLHVLIGCNAATMFLASRIDFQVSTPPTHITQNMSNNFTWHPNKRFVAEVKIADCYNVIVCDSVDHPLQSHTTKLVSDLAINDDYVTSAASV
ncbi:MAG: type II TA system antitoxin MqsA family protein [Pseudomonadota bacterium]